MFRLLFLSVLVATGIQILDAVRHDEDFVFPIDMPKADRKCMKICDCLSIEDGQLQADCMVECHYNCLSEDEIAEVMTSFISAEICQSIRLTLFSLWVRALA